MWLNGLWFSGLVLSLAPAFLAIMSKQWLDEFSKGLSGASRSVARERQYRLNNLKKWRVGDIVDLIPLLLQLALTCFLAGLLILLWTLHHTLAIIMSGLVGVLATFVITTALLPLFIPSCAYLSPQTHMIDNIFQPNHFESWLSSTSATKQPKSGPSSVSQGTGSDPESTSPPQGRRCPDWITDIWLSWSVKGLKIVQTLKDRPTRQGREQSAIKDVSSELDIQLLVEACSFTLRPEPVSATAVCLTAVEDKDVLLFFQQLRKSTRAHFGATADASSGPIGRGNQHQLLWLQVMLCVVSTGDTSLSSKDIDTLGLYAHWGQWPPNMNDVEVEWAGFCLSSIMECLQESITRGEQPTYQPSFLDGMMQAFLSNVISRKASSRKVVWQGAIILFPIVQLRASHADSDPCQVIASSYRAVRLSESLLAKRPSDNALRVSHGYAGNVRRFLERANRALTSQPTGVDGSYLEKIRTYTGDVLTEVARSLSKLPTTRFYANLFYYDLVDSLADQMTLDGPGVLQCLPSDSVPDFICMLEQLAARVEEDPPLWSSYKPALDALMRQVKLGVAGESIVNPLTLITVHGVCPSLSSLHRRAMY